MKPRINSAQQDQRLRIRRGSEIAGRSAGSVPAKCPRKGRQESRGSLSRITESRGGKRGAAEKVKKGTKLKEAKVSATDPQARLMKFADKSVKAGYNCQMAIDPESFVVLGLEVTQRSNDTGLLKPMIDQLE
jgi:hypothetical protein